MKFKISVAIQWPSVARKFGVHDRDLMISRISGKLISVSEDVAEVEMNGLTYEVLIPGILNKKLLTLLNSDVSFYTYHYLEGGIGGGNLTPRLVGFLDLADKEFFELFITVQGIGVRKALKALTVSIDRIAAAIETRDMGVLVSLPGVGRRASEKIVAELNGKCTKFALKKQFGEAEETPFRAPGFRDEAMDVLLQLQYKPVEADRMIQQALEAEPKIDATERLLDTIFKMRKVTG
jgi:Holliday junction DNA helicase RuvA